MSRPNKLQLVSYLAPNMFWFYEAVAAYLGRVFGVETHIMQSLYDPLEDPVLLEDQLDIALICGLPFIRLSFLLSSQLTAIVAPVMQATRYQNRPVYFSDIIVNADSDIKTLDDLGGTTLCYNDPGSNSGYNLLRYRLLQAGYPSSFFCKVIQSGSHQRSITWVAYGLAGCSAIDSTVLEQELRDSPELSHCLRVIESIGPCPMPPVVVSQRLGTAFIDELRSAFLQPDTELLSAMNQAQIQQYVVVKGEDYEAIAMMYDAAIQADYDLIAI